MAEQWTDPRKRPPPQMPRKPGMSPVRRPMTTRRRGVPEGAEGEEEAPAPPKKDRTPLYIAAAAGGAVLLFAAIALTGGGSSYAKRPRGSSGYAGPAVPVQVQESTPKYRPPEGVSPNDCGSISAICNKCEYESDYAACRSCPARNFFFWDQENERFVCFRCGAATPVADIRCEKCGGAPFRRPLIKAR